MTGRSVLALAVVLALAACGSGGGKAGGAVVAVSRAGVQYATLDGDDKLDFNPATVRAKPGKVSLTLRVTGGIPHNLEVGGVPGAAIPNVPGHESSSVSFTVGPGSYQLICTYHPGMRGTLIVAP
ncbi:MAG: hypothetical protein QOJ92_2701 [Frankiales bacterium]|nr:hypothetical protein [Frankiales bacterium]